MLGFTERYVFSVDVKIRISKPAGRSIGHYVNKNIALAKQIIFLNI